MKKKRYQRIAAFFIASILCTYPFSASALEDWEQEKESIEQEIKDNQQEQSKKEGEIGDILNQLDALQSQRDAYNNENVKLQKAMKTITEQMKAKQVEIDQIQAAYDEQYDDMKLRIQYMYENGNTQLLDLFFSSATFADFLNKAQYFSDIVQYDRDMLKRMDDTRVALVNAKDELEQQRQSYADKQEEVKQNLAKIVSLQEETDRLYQEKSEELGELALEKTQLKENLSEIDAKMEAYQKEQEEIKRQQEEEQKQPQEEQQKQEEEQKQQEEEQTEQTSVSSSVTLIWPAPGCYQINTYFGYQTDGYHQGIELEADYGTSYVAAADGTIVFSGWSDALGDYIMLDCGNGICAIYAYSSELYYSTGDYVTQGTVLGLTGDSGSQSDGAQLYFAVLKDGDYVDPLSYLEPFGQAPVTGDGQSIVDVALSQLGNVGGQPYWSWYGFSGRVEWCACFVSWCANQCGYIDAGLIPKFSLCRSGVSWFKENGQWKDRSYEPSAGDIIFFDWDYDGVPDHVGIVEKSSGSTVYTVEGNSGDACKQMQYTVGERCIFGYGVPAY